LPIVTEEAWPPLAGSTARCCIHPEDDAACDYEADEVDLVAREGHSYQHIAYLVDAHLVDEGDSDLTRKSPAWRAVEAQRKEWAKCPPRKPRVHREQGDQPDTVSMPRRETRPDSTSARAERTATVCPPAGAQTPTRRRSERRVEQVEHLVDGPALDQELDGGPRNV
jgi:hypothetical protein